MILKLFDEVKSLSVINMQRIQKSGRGQILSSWHCSSHQLMLSVNRQLFPPVYIKGSVASVAIVIREDDKNKITVFMPSGIFKEL